MFSDEMLGAYLDGELGPEQRALVDRHLEADSSLVDRLERLRRIDDMLRRALPQQVSPPSDPILAMLTSQVRVAPRRQPGRVLVQAVGLAAACAIGAIAGQLMPSGGELGLLAMSADMNRALDETPSGERAPLVDGELAVGFSLRSESGEICRQFEVQSAGETVDALACRESGTWRMRVQALADAGSGSGYTVAGSANPVDVVIASMGEVSLLGQDDEQALIANGWR